MQFLMLEQIIVRFDGIIAKSTAERAIAAVQRGVVLLGLAVFVEFGRAQ